MKAAAFFVAAPLCALASGAGAEFSEIGFRESPHGHDHGQCTDAESKLAPFFSSGSKVDLSVIGTLAFGGSTGEPEELQAGGHDPVRQGLNLQSLELVLRGNLGSRLDALAVVLTGIDEDDQGFIELEEAWVQATAGKLSLRVGQLLTQFGLFNPIHLHQWAFVDSSLVNVRMLGEDGLRSPGAQLGWEMPTPFESELIFTIQNAQENHGHGEENGHLHGSGLLQETLYAGRYELSYGLGRTQTVSAGFSAALGGNDFGPQYQTTLLGLDFCWRWQLKNRAYPFVSWQSEFISRRAEASVEETGTHSDEPDGHHREDKSFGDWGFYSQVLWGFSPGWIAGLRADHVQAENSMEEHSRFSPNLTWIPSQWCKVRLQYNYDYGQGSEHSVWLQFAFFVGSHKAH